MKQLLIVTANQNFTGETMHPFTNGLADGAVGIITENQPTLWEDDGSTGAVNDIRSDFWLCHKVADQPMKVIEVDKESLQVTRQFPQAGSKWKAEVQIPTPTDGSTYTLILVKKGTVPHERNTWTATETVFVGDSSATAATVAAALIKSFNNMFAYGAPSVTVGLKIDTSGNTPVTVTDTIVFEATKDGEQWELIGADDLTNITVTSTPGAYAVGDVAHIKKLASECAANFGFTDTYRDGDTIYPGYPVNVPAGVYAIYTLRFATNRKASKTRDERASQLVHIAVWLGQYQDDGDYSEAALYDTITNLDKWFKKVFVADKGIVSNLVTDGLSDEIDGNEKPTSSSESQGN